MFQSQTHRLLNANLYTWSPYFHSDGFTINWQLLLMLQNELDPRLLGWWGVRWRANQEEYWSSSRPSEITMNHKRELGRGQETDIMHFA